MVGALLVVGVIQVLERASVVESGVEAGLVARDGGKLVNPKIDGSDEDGIDTRLFDRVLIDDFDDVARSAWHDAHTIEILPTHLCLDLDAQPRRHDLACLLENPLADSLLVVDQAIATLLFGLVARDLGASRKLFGILFPFLQGPQEGDPVLGDLDQDGIGDLGRERPRAFQMLDPMEDCRVRQVCALMDRGLPDLLGGLIGEVLGGKSGSGPGFLCADDSLQACTDYGE